MKAFKFIVLFLLISVAAYAADCGPFGCIFSPGTICVDGKCVPKTTPVPTAIPTPTPTPTATPVPTPTPSISDITLDLVPLAKVIVKEIDCSVMDMKNIRVILKRKTPPPTASFYSMIFYTKNQTTDFYSARKDLMNRYVFLPEADLATMKPQFIGTDFAFTQWENTAFKEVFSTLSCAELKQLGYYFVSGISISGNLSDLETAVFVFK